MKLFQFRQLTKHLHGNTELRVQTSELKPTRALADLGDFDSQGLLEDRKRLILVVAKPRRKSKK